MDKFYSVKEISKNTEKIQKEALLQLEEAKRENVEPVLDIEKMNLSDNEKQFVGDLKDSMRRIGTMSNKEIKQIYKDLKMKFYATKEGKKEFQQKKKIVKGMIKNDGSRTNLRHVKNAGLLTTALGLFGGYYFGAESPFLLNIYPNMGGIDNLFNHYHKIFVNNLEAYQGLVPESSLVFATIGAGIALYAGGKALVKLDDMNTMRRIMVQVCVEDVSINELQALRQTLLSGTNDIKEAMISYPIKDYGKSSETLAREKWLKAQESLEQEVQPTEKVQEELER